MKTTLQEEHQEQRGDPYGGRQEMGSRQLCQQVEQALPKVTIPANSAEAMPSGTSNAITVKPAIISARSQARWYAGNHCRIGK